MKYFSSILLVFFALSLTACLPEKEIDPNDPILKIEITDAYAFATMPGGATGAAFMVIKNGNDTDDTLIGAKTDLAGVTEVHENLIDPDDGTMMMRKIKGINIPAGDNATLEPTGKHIMLLKLKQPLTLDSSFDLTLSFQNVGEKNVSVSVIQPGTKPKK